MNHLNLVIFLHTLCFSLYNQKANSKGSGQPALPRSLIRAFAVRSHRILEYPRDKTNKMAVHPAKIQVSVGIRPVWSRVFTVPMKKDWVISYPLSTQRRLIKLGGCPGWSESSLGAQSFGFVMRQLIKQKEASGKSCAYVCTSLIVHKCMDPTLSSTELPATCRQCSLPHSDKCRDMIETFLKWM